MLHTLCILLAAPAGARACGDWHAEVISAEGVVEVQRQGAVHWHEMALGDTVCTGDSIRLRAFSRAAVQLPDKTVLRFDEHTSVVFAQPEDEAGSWLELVRGIIHVISRDPRSLRFTTPYANAGLEGTEFVLAVTDEQTLVTVIEGEVVLSNEAGRVGVPSGNAASAQARQAPTSSPVPRPLDAARWTLYYVPILAAEQPAADRSPGSAEQHDPQFHTARAARRLATGRVSEAAQDLTRAQQLDPADATALALRSIIALTQHDRTAALDLAQDAVRRDPTSSPALIALSHAQQAHFDLSAAHASLESAVKHNPHDAIAWARLAELTIALSDVDGGIRAAETSLSISPTFGHAHAMLGFAQLMRMAPGQAAQSFRRAIEQDQASPLPRLGLGLALMRQRRPAEGREQMEIAVLLDPGNALARSYMGKTYHEEHRGELTETQLELAKAFDPLDPTPWLYDALRKHSVNRPVAALQDLRAAADLNGNRPVFRSRLVVDEDLAARSAGLGRLHRDLGFEQLALMQGWKASLANPRDHSGHRLLADVYSALPRHEIARVNELYQSQLLQPINVTPIPPQLAEANLFILDTAGPTDVAFSEFTPLVNGNGIGLQASAVAGGQSTTGENVIVAGLHDKISYSVGHFGFRTDGFRPNNDLDQRVANAFVQFRASHRTSAQAELRTTRTEKGDLHMLFDPAAFDPAARQKEAVDSVRIGLRRDLSDHSTLLASLIYEAADGDSVGEHGFSILSELDGYGIDVQHLYDQERWNLSAGVRYLNQNLVDTFSVLVPVPFPPFALEQTVTTHTDLQHASLYAYANVDLRSGLVATFGASVDSMEALLRKSDTQLNPKLGITWEPTSRTTLRAAAFRTLQGPIISRHNIQPRLEPGHVSGFNQFFFGTAGEDAWTYGLSVDHRLSETVYIGAQAAVRRLDVPIAFLIPPSPTPSILQVGVEESLHRAYAYWTPVEAISVSTQYHYERFDSGDVVLANRSSLSRTHRFPLALNYFHRSGISAGARATYAAQTGNFAVPGAPPADPGPFGPEETLEPGSARFWVFDLSLGYRFPRRRGLLSLNAHNVFDRQFRFQDLDPENPRILPERMLSLRFTLAY